MSSKKPNDLSPCTTNEKRPRTRQTELALLNTFVPAFVSLTWPTLLFEFRTDVREHDSRANRMKWHPTKVNYFCTHQCESSENNRKDAALVTGLSTATHNKTSRNKDNKERNKTNAWLWIKAKKTPQKNEFLSFGRLLNTNAIVFTR